MTYCWLIGLTVVFSVWSVPAQATLGVQAITVAQIAAAISDSGLNVSAEQVSLLSGVVAKTSAPVLRVETVTAWEGNQSHVRLACVPSDACLPFIVAVRRGQKSDSVVLSAPAYSHALKQAPVEPPTSKIAVRIGSTAILLLDGSHVHIRVPVVCLENGFVGQTIHVTGKGRELTYLAVVGGDGLLRGRL